MRNRAFSVQILFLLFALLMGPLSAQGDMKQNEKALTIKLGISVPQLQVAVKPEKSTGAALNYRPNAPSKTFLSMSYKWFGATVGGINPVQSKEEVSKGFTTATDYQFRFYFSRLAAEIFYQKYRGYYIENTQDVIAGWDSSQPFRQLPDLETEHRGITLTYIMHPDQYSMSSAFDHSTQQTRSGGSFLFNLSFSQDLFSNSSALVPIEIASRYGNFEKVKSGQLSSATFGVGGGYNLVMFEKFYFAAQFILGLGTHLGEIEKTDGTKGTSTSGSQVHVKAGTGYNGDSVLLGFQVVTDAVNYKVDDSSLSFQTVEVSLFAGTRF